MGGRRTTPSPDDVRCPDCASIAWRRLGERVVEGGSEGGQEMTLRHFLVNENAPLDWTCDRCGYRVKAGSRIDLQVSKVQGAPASRVGGLAFLGGIWDLVDRVGPTTTAVSTVTVGVVAVAIVALLARGAPASPDPAAATPGGSPRATEERTIDQAAIERATDASLAGRRVELAARVRSVTGDATFWVGASNEDRTFVVLDEQVQGEEAVTVREGQTVRIAGSLARTPVEGVEVSDADRQALEEEVLYIRADRVVIEGG